MWTGTRKRFSYSFWKPKIQNETKQTGATPGNKQKSANEIKHKHQTSMGSIRNVIYYPAEAIARQTPTLGNNKQLIYNRIID